MNDARTGLLDGTVVDRYSAMVEGSVVTASKALHFAAPSVVPIYDRWVHAAFFQAPKSRSNVLQHAFTQVLRAQHSSHPFATRPIRSYRLIWA